MKRKKDKLPTDNEGNEKETGTYSRDKDGKKNNVTKCTQTKLI